MKISNKTLLGGLAFAIALTGCGGSGANNYANVPHGIYTSTNSNDIAFTNDMAGNAAQPISMTVKTFTYTNGPGGVMYAGGLGRIIKFNTTNPVSWSAYAPTGANGLVDVTAVAFDSNNRIYCTDYTNQRIVRIDNLNGDGRVDLDLSPFSLSAVDMSYTLAIDSQNRIYVAGWSSGKILRFSSMTDNSPITYQPTGAHQVLGVISLVIDHQDRIYFGDNLKGRIVRIDDMSGSNWTEFGSLGSGSNQFKLITGLSLDQSSRIYVADHDNNRIARIDDMTGSGWTTYGDSSIFPDMFGVLAR